MSVEQLLLKTPQQLKEYCQTLSKEDKLALYKQLVDEAKDKDYKELKKLNKLVNAIEETTDKKLYSHSEEATVKSFFKKATKRIFLILHPTYSNNLKELNELDQLLPQIYEKLKPGLTDNIRHCMEKELRFGNFLHDNIEVFRLLEESRHGSIEKKKEATIKLISLFAMQPELNYAGDILLLGIISDNIKVFGKEAENLKSDLDTLINLVEKSADKLINMESDIEETEEELAEKREAVVEQLLAFRLDQFIKMH
ncbi:MAG: hypothetical protein LKM43_00475 [Wolbachia endosymbiont of Penenirmus auritus]|nr:hypothetical protein [Wolbachia endosymbiont of Penenirmus auritus]